MADNDAVSFDLLESHKENITSLPSGRSAKALAAIYSPPLTARPTPLSDTNTPARTAFETELACLDEVDDPLDVYDRYVKWIETSYPDPAAPQAGLSAVLERGMKAFVKRDEYKNDVRYLRLWLRYITFSESPREVFVYLARNGIGEGLALYYEEFAGWLEGEGRWGQAAEVYALGLEKGARPQERLGRRAGEFEQRRKKVGEVGERPDSPALPVVRAVLGEKVDPFAARQGQAEVKGEKKKKAKMAIFADGEAKESVLGSGDGNWEFGTAKGRKKENSAEATAWDGQTLKVGKTNAGMGKMEIFKLLSQQGTSAVKSNHEAQCTTNPRTGKREMVFVNLDVVYTDLGRTKVEFSFEEVMAKHRGWLERDWKAENREREQQERRLKMAPPEKKPKKKGFEIFNDSDSPASLPAPVVESLEPSPVETVPIRTVVLNDENNENAMATRPVKNKQEDVAKRMRREERANRTRKIKVMEVRHEKKETQTVQLNLASPTGPKIRKMKKTAEPTMTINTKEAMDEIYGIFSAPGQTDTAEAEDEDEDSEDDYTSGGESTTTGRMSAPTSEYGDETRNEILRAYGDQEHDTADVEEQDDDAEATTDAEEKTEVTGWSDFTTSKHVPREEQGHDVAHKAKLQIFQDDAEPEDPSLHVDDHLTTPCEDESSPPETLFIPLPPEDFEHSSATYRSRAVMANNRLPFMTPIAEQTESSIGTARTEKERDYFTTKTPSRQSHAVQPILEDDDEVWSSPFQEQVKEAAKDKKALLQQGKKTNGLLVSLIPDAKSTSLHLSDGPIIPDKQVNPCDPQIRDIILANMQPSLRTYPNFYDHRDEEYGRIAEIRKYAKAVSKKAGASDKTASTLSLPPTLTFPGSDNAYTIRRELGCGAFGPVYLVEQRDSTSDSDNGTLQAMKLELSPPSAWEYHMLHLTRTRLSSHTRILDSIIPSHALHLYRDASFLIESYADTGTLLDLVNVSRSLEGCNGGAGAGLEESVAMFYTVELLRVVEAMHAKGLIHGDLKADNVMLRLGPSPSLSSSSTTSSTSSPRHHPSPSKSRPDWSQSYSPAGRDGWSHHGLTLIDFGRGIDMSAFRPDVRFVADWPTTEADCVEMRELRPWTWQIDYHGLAGTAHTLLWGRYMAIVPDKTAPAPTPGSSSTKRSRFSDDQDADLIDLDAVEGAAAQEQEDGEQQRQSQERAISEIKRWRTRESLKRYWQTDIWGEFFALMLNSASEGSARAEVPQGKMPLVNGMRRVREMMERHLEGCVGLQDRIRRLEEAAVYARRKKGGS
ncbi:hypothetical protein CAC42_6822 [Sphaceloma murrayae]|uniref:Checkpoint serine/threonine-protein kinase bub1 n=1 Tax=Sphaceloma murrayae TaxID=2082308 RepID=A0A2K1QHC2_9PEZI|nr:hypothetical protein CAC42_6822 [Sphaceloma murrayae]